MEIIFLGTGTSIGVPIPDCNCLTCSSDSPKNKRFRSSLYLRFNNTGILIDTPPELRQQLLRYNILEVNHILLTHAHADHIMGFDDIRILNHLQDGPIPVYGNKETTKAIKRIFPYIFEKMNEGGGIPKINLTTLKNSVLLDGVKFTVLPVKHGSQNVLGFRCGKFAYITDCSFIPESTYKLLEGTELLILGALRHKEHSTHMNIREARRAATRIGARKVYFTHLAHDLEYYRDNKNLPDHINLAYDGLKLQVKEVR
ncbi:MAG: MBL fold metallo-hydrolase [Halanaerobiales bacterium]